jgi:hypothetical protein
VEVLMLLLVLLLVRCCLVVQERAVLQVVAARGCSRGMSVQVRERAAHDRRVQQAQVAAAAAAATWSA